MRRIKLIEDGNFTGWLRLAFIVFGFVLMFCAFKFIPPTVVGGGIALLGFGLALIGGFASRAAMLKIKPFGQSQWRKAKRTYGKDDKS